MPTPTHIKYQRTICAALKSLKLAATYIEDGAALDAARCASEAVPLLFKASMLRSNAMAAIGQDKYRCQNCLKEWSLDQLLNPIPDYSERVGEDEPQPDGECPACRALCHKVTA